jgi:hypothetical protein
MSIWGDKIRQDQNLQEKFHEHNLKKVYENIPERILKYIIQNKSGLN